MSLHISEAAATPGQIPSGGSVTITVNCHVDKESARGGARYTLPPGPAVFRLPEGDFKRIFLPEFTLTNVSSPVEARLVVVSPPIISMPIEVEIADLDENPPDTRTRRVIIDVT
jgi:hypothetical protein